MNSVFLPPYCRCDEEQCDDEAISRQLLTLKLLENKHELASPQTLATAYRPFLGGLKIIELSKEVLSSGCTSMEKERKMAESAYQVIELIGTGTEF